MSIQANQKFPNRNQKDSVGRHLTQNDSPKCKIANEREFPLTSGHYFALFAIFFHNFKGLISRFHGDFEVGLNVVAHRIEGT